MHIFPGECDQVTMARFFKDLIASERTSVDSVVVVSPESDQLQDLLIRSQDEYDEDEELIFVTAVPSLEDYHDSFSYSTLYLVADSNDFPVIYNVSGSSYKVFVCEEPWNDGLFEKLRLDDLVFSFSIDQGLVKIHERYGIKGEPR